jgi:hypothetical protein
MSVPFCNLLRMGMSARSRWLIGNCSCMLTMVDLTWPRRHWPSSSRMRWKKYHVPYSSNLISSDLFSSHLGINRENYLTGLFRSEDVETGAMLRYQWELCRTISTIIRLIYLSWSWIQRCSWESKTFHVSKRMARRNEWFTEDFSIWKTNNILQDNPRKYWFFNLLQFGPISNINESRKLQSEKHELWKIPIKTGISM